MNRKAPIKMIWFLVVATLTLLACGLLFAEFASGGRTRALLNQFRSYAPMLLVTAGAASALSLGVIDLSQAGVMAICGAVFATVGNGLPILGIVLALFLGMICGLLQGVFALLAKKGAAVVTALTSVGFLFLGTTLGNLLTGGTMGRIPDWPIAEIAKAWPVTLSVALMLIAFVYLLLSVFGFHKAALEPEHPKGAARLVICTCSGLFSALAALIYLGSVRFYTPGLFESSYLFPTVLILCVAGAAIPNLRRSKLEQIFGFASVIFAAVTYLILNYLLSDLFMRSGGSSYATPFVFAVLLILFAVPNAIFARKAGLNE